MKFATCNVENDTFAAKLAFKRATNLHKIGAYDKALIQYRFALSHDPDMVECLNDMGVTLRKMGKFQASSICYQRALKLQPYDSRAKSNLANVLQDLGRYDEALKLMEEVLSTHAHHGENWYATGVILRDMGRIHDAALYLEKALSMENDNPKYKWDYALSLLQRGKYQEGFEYYESRWSLPHFSLKHTQLPRWQGEDLTGKRIFVHCEQGFGDMIQFVRFVPLLKQMGAQQVILESKPETKTLFESIKNIDQVVTEKDPIPEVDYTVAMMSLGKLLRISCDSIPFYEGYISAQKNYETGTCHLPESPGLKIGFAWAGSPTHKNDRNRSCSIEHFIDLMEITGTSFYSLQKGHSASQLEDTGIHHICYDLGLMINDFSDTASLISQLDLVICVDTSIAHLAGALGKEVWVAQAKASDWRWLTGRSSSPWYSQLRLFQQPQCGDWDSVFADLKQALCAKLLIVA